MKRLRPAHLASILTALTAACWHEVVIEPLGAGVGRQKQQIADEKSRSCVACHGSTDSPTMHETKALHLGCTDCHGGQAEVAVPKDAAPGTDPYREAMASAHVQPRHPDAWKRADGTLSSANPERSYTLLNAEDPRFVRFVNPGDLRVARLVCGPCHPSEVARVSRSLMTTSAAFFGAASYNNGIVAEKPPFLGESYAIDGTAQALRAERTPTPEQLDRGVLPYLLPLPRWQVVPPGDIFRVFERGGRSIPTAFGDIGTAPSRAVQGPSEEEPGRPDIQQSVRGPGTGLRIAVPVLNLQKTRLNDPHLSFLGTNDHPGDYRSSGCSACHVVYANDRDPLDAGPYARLGNRGRSVSQDPTIPKRESGHPLRHVFTNAIPTSQCMVCHMHQPNVFLNSFLGYTMWDYETDGELMWPKDQRHPSTEEIWKSLDANPEEAATRGNWNEYEFLARVSEMNPKLGRTQFADYHGHGWNFRAVFKRDRKGNLLDDQGDVIADVTPEKLHKAIEPRTEKEWKLGRPGIPVHLKDIHLEKGMHCVDCHFDQDVHGTGDLLGQFMDAIEISCTDCHGTIERRALLKTSGPAARGGGADLSFGRTAFKKPRFEWRGQSLYQRSMIDPKLEWEVVQTADTVDPDSAWSKANPERAERSRLAKTLQQDGVTWGRADADPSKLAHSNQRMACYTCHLSWTPSCGGCHLPIKANWKKRSNHYEGEETRNWASYNPQILRDDQFMLGIHGTVRRGGLDNILIAPIRSSSALVLSSENANREHIYVQQPPISSAGFSSQAFAPHFPHTVRATETKRCTDCHVAKDGDNNAWLAQVLGQGTNFTNFIGRYVYVGEEGGVEAVPVTEWNEPQAVIGSYLHELAYPEDHAAHEARGRTLPKGSAKAHSGGEIRSVQMRGEYLYTASGEDGFRVFDIASIDNKGVSENIVSAPVSPLGQSTHVRTSFATAVALPTTMPVSPSRQDRPAFSAHAKENQEQRMHPIYRYAFVTDRDEGLIIVDVETLSDGEPRNNFLERALTFNPAGALTGATNITIAGTNAYVSAKAGLVVVSLSDPLHPQIVTTIGAPRLTMPTVVAVQFRYAFVIDEKGLEVVDVTRPSTPAVVEGARVPIADARDLYVARGYAYVAAGRAGLAIVDVERPEHPKLDQIFDANGRINDATAVRIGSTNASLFAYVADGINGLRVLQLTSPVSQPNYYGFNPRPVPELISTYETKDRAIALSKGLDRDRAVDESGNQVSVFGRLGARPFTLMEQQKLYLKNGALYAVADAPPSTLARRPVPESKPKTQALPVATNAPKRFDHSVHDKKPIACNTCHRLSASAGWLQRLPVGFAGEPHGACTGSACHLTKFIQFNAKRDLEFCLECHVDPRRSPKLHFPPYRERGESDFTLARFDHGSHAKIDGTACSDCHVALSVRARPGHPDRKRMSHEACASAKCHGDKVAPKMPDCAGCHESRGRRAVVPLASAVMSRVRVSATFGHDAHERASKTKDCVRCHTNVAVEKGEAVPLPPMRACDSCHDGRAAFDALGSKCKKCHGRIEGAPPPPATTGPGAVFRHATHADLVCTRCHSSSADGALSRVGSDHKPCADAKCHARDFESAEPRICATCHLSNDPVDNPLAKKTSAKEFSVSLSHQDHLALKMFGGSGCTSCHSEETGVAPPPVPAGTIAPAHVLCASCHASKAKPAMTACDACHRLAREADGEWRVGKRFPHGRHKNDVRTNRPLACDYCHRGIRESSADAPPPRPPMSLCADACHNGTTAFKTTGFECKRCHGPANEARR